MLGPVGELHSLQSCQNFRWSRVDNISLFFCFVYSVFNCISLPLFTDRQWQCLFVVHSWDIQPYLPLKAGKNNVADARNYFPRLYTFWYTCPGRAAMPNLDRCIISSQRRKYGVFSHLLLSRAAAVYRLSAWFSFSYSVQNTSLSWGNWFSVQ